MSDMTVKECAEKILKDKAFRVEVINNCYDVNPAEGDKDALFKWLYVGVERMGYSFGEATFTEELKAQFNKLSGFKKIGFVGSLITKTNKAKKATGAF